MVKVQEHKGRYSITIPHVIAEAMGLKKGDKVNYRWNGHAWELRKE